MNEQMTLRGTLRGQDGEITQIATNTEYPKMILSASRGKIYQYTNKIFRMLDARFYIWFS